MKDWSVLFSKHYCNTFIIIHYLMLCGANLITQHMIFMPNSDFGTYLKLLCQHVCIMYLLVNKCLCILLLRLYFICHPVIKRRKWNRNRKLIYKKIFTFSFFFKFLFRFQKHFSMGWRMNSEYWTVSYKFMKNKQTAVDSAQLL